MKQFVGILLVSFSLNLFAAFHIATKLESDGTVEASPDITIKNKKWTTVVENDVIFKIKAEETSKESLKINVKIYKGTQNKKGQIGRAQFIAKWNESVTKSFPNYRLTLLPLKEGNGTTVLP